MIFQYKYVEQGEALHWDNIKTGTADLGDVMYLTIAERNAKIDKQANIDAAAEFMRIAEDLARVEGYELDKQKTLKVAMEQKRVVIAVIKFPKQKGIHER